MECQRLHIVALILPCVHCVCGYVYGCGLYLGDQRRSEVCQRLLMNVLQMYCLSSLCRKPCQLHLTTSIRRFRCLACIRRMQAAGKQWRRKLAAFQTATLSH